MNRIQSGFSLLECLLYVVLSVFVSMITFQWLISSHQRITKAHNESALSASHQSACDVLRRDLMQAQTCYAAWKMSSNNSYVWALRDYDVGWELKDGRVIRSEGIYNSNSQSWVQVSHALLAERIEEFAITPAHEMHNAMQYKIKAQQQEPLCGLITLRCRNISHEKG